MKTLFSLLLLSILVLSSCRKDEPNDHATTSKVYINVVNKFDGNPLANNDTLVDGHGHSFYLNPVDLKMYLSGITFDNIAVDGQALVGADDGQYYIGELRSGDYSKISIGIGLDSVLNASDPVTFESSHPLSYNQGMYWVWATKYRFFKVQGVADVDGDNVFDDGVVYHIGTNQLYRTTEFTKSITAKDGKDVVINLEIDWYRFFDGLNLSSELNTHTTSDLPLATKVADNAPGTLSIQ